jgi:3-oxoacyl-[acyl-carrier protein] reductase
MPFDLGLADRVAVVTGAAQGIGAEYAAALAEQCAAVVVADIDADGAQAVAAELATNGHDATAATVDVSDRDSTLALSELVRARYGTAHIVVNNAAIFHGIRHDPQLTVDIDYWRKIYSVNLDGALLVTQAFAPMLIEAQWGRVVMQSSVGAFSGGGAYNSAKLALLGVMRGFAKELGSHGVTVNAIAPGPVMTEATQVSVSPERIAQLVGQAFIARAGEPDDLVGTLLFLCSELAGWMTGQTLIVDGGITGRL